MAANVLVETRDMTREEWLAARRTAGIGASDAAAVLGLSPWKSPVQLYMEKVGEIPEPEATERMEFGLMLEDVIADYYVQRNDIRVRRRNAILQHPDYPWMICNLDRVIVGQPGILEIKTTNAFNRDEWEDDVPIMYLVQVQHQLAVTGKEFCDVACLVGGNHYVQHRVWHNEAIIKRLIEEEDKFWNQHVVPRIPPEWDGSEASTKLLAEMYPEAKAGKSVVLPSDVLNLIRRRNELAEAIQGLEQQKVEAENKIKGLLEDAEIGVVPGLDKPIRFTSVSTTRLDTAALKQAHPNIYAEFSKPSTYRRLFIPREV